MESSLKRVVIKEELWKLTGDHFKAIILNQFIYWSQRVGDFDRYIAEERHRMELEGKQLNMQPINGWIYKSAEELIEETMLDISAATIGRHIQILVDKGYLMWRHNPEHKWDRTKQYRVDFVRVREDLSKLGYTLEGYGILALKDASFKMKNGDFNLQNQTIQNERAITEITTETINKDYINNNKSTIENCTENLPVEIKKRGKNPVVVNEQLDEVIKEVEQQLGTSVNTLLAYFSTWMEQYGKDYILQRAAYVRKQATRNRVGAFRQAIQEQWEVPSTEPVTETERDERYANFYKLFPNG